MPKENFLKAIQELKKSEKKRNFSQTIDLIINLKNFDVRREAFNIFIQLPHKIKDKKVAGFLEKKHESVFTIKKDDFSKYKEKKDIKKLLKNYDFFIANAKLMPAIATSFGRVLGPVGKMPSPQLGILMTEDENSIKQMLDKINSTVRIMVKQPSIKLAIGKDSMKDEELAENAFVVYNKILENLKRKTDNIKSIMVKFTMDKPIKVKI